MFLLLVLVVQLRPLWGIRSHAVDSLDNHEQVQPRHAAEISMVEADMFKKETAADHVDLVSRQDEGSNMSDYTVIDGLRRHYDDATVKEFLSLMPPFTSGPTIHGLAREYDRNQVKDILQVMKAGVDERVIYHLTMRYDYATVKEFLSLMPPYTSGHAIEKLILHYDRNQLKELLPVMKPGVDPSVIDGMARMHDFKDVKYFLSGPLPPFTSGKAIDSLTKRFKDSQLVGKLMQVMKPGMDETVTDSLSYWWRDDATVKEFLSLMPPYTSGKTIDRLAREYNYDRRKVKDILQVMKAGMDDTVIDSLSRRYDYATVKEFLSLMPPFTSGKAIEKLVLHYDRNQIKELLPVMKPGVDPSVIDGMARMHDFKDVKHFLSGPLPPFTSGKAIDSLTKRFNSQLVGKLMQVMKAGIDYTVIDSLTRHYDYATVKEFLSLMPPFTSGETIDYGAEFKGYWFITGVK